VLLGLPADHLAGVPFFHAVHLDLLDDDVPAPHGRDDGFPLDAGGLEQTPNSLRHDAGVHDLPLDDRVRRDLRGGHLDQLRLAPGMVNNDQFDDPGPDIEPN